jgi:endonuclease-8
MPEGDTIFRVAQILNRALAGRMVTAFESVYPALTRVDEDHPLRGRTIESVISRGKHVLMAFSGDLILHTHMRMNGSWHIYRIGERWRRPRADMRVAISTDMYVAVGFNVPVAELLSRRQVERHEVLRKLGPDLAAEAFDHVEVTRRLRQQPHAAIADALLDQRAVAGIGNVLKSEILFVAGVHPFEPVSCLGDGDIERVITSGRTAMAANTRSRGRMMTPAAARRTTGSLDPSAKLWVYGRAGKPCRRCGTPIHASKTGIAARATYWCPRCQARKSTGS